MLRQLSYAIKNQLGHPKPPTKGFGTQKYPHWGYFACSSLVLYGIRIVGYHARKGPITGAQSQTNITVVKNRNEFPGILSGRRRNPKYLRLFVTPGDLVSPRRGRFSFSISHFLTSFHSPCRRVWSLSCSAPWALWQSCFTSCSEDKSWEGIFISKYF